MKKLSVPVTNIGSVSLLMTFIILCLVTFSTLSLSHSASEYRYSLKLAEHNQAYYAASAKASVTLAKIDAILNEAYKDNRAGYCGEVAEKLAQLGNVATDFSGDVWTVSFTTPVDDAQALQVVLTLNQPEDSAGGYYKITSWRESNARVWKGDDSLHLISPPTGQTAP